MSNNSDWYKQGWSLDIMNQSWTESTVAQVDFIIDKMRLKGHERILDLACGYGRHALEFARKGYEIVGVDITVDFVNYGNEQAKKEGLNAKFILADIREVSYENKFDVVLNMADGAIGYLETDEENMKIFKVISKALKPGGQHFMDIVSGDYADTHFPCKLWDAGEKGLTLSQFNWNRDTRIMLYGQLDYKYGKIFPKPEMNPWAPTRLYTVNEVVDIMKSVGMTFREAYADVNGTPASANGIQMMAFSQKKV
jgi:SAM-dependent methyltransferase